MLRAMRSSAKYIALVFVTIPFIIWLVTAQVSGVLGSNPNVVLKVNKEKFNVNDFQQRVQIASDQYRQQNGSAPVSREEDEQIRDQVINQMIQDALLRQEYKRLGIRVSDQEIIDMARNSPPPEVTRDPQFQTDSQFDLRKWQQFLSTTSDRAILAQLEQIYRDQIPRIKLAQYLTSDVYVSDAKLWRIYKDQHDSVEVAAVAIWPYTIPDSSHISDAELTAYMKKHPDDFPKQPSVAYVRFISVPRLPNAADTAAARARVARVRAELVRGAKFDEVAKRESSDSSSGQQGGSIGWIKRNETRLVEPFMQAVRALKPGQLSAPVESQFGYHLIRIDDAKGDSVKVRHILIPIALQGDHLDQVEARADTMERLAAERSDPTILDTTAHRMGLPLSTTYQIVEGQPFTVGQYRVPDVSVWAFESPVGETSPVIEATSGFYVFRLDSLTPGGEAQLTDNQVRARVTALVRLERQKVLARQRADSIAKTLSSGDLIAAARARGLDVQRLGWFTRLHPPAYFSNEPAAVGTAFGLGVGERSGVIEGERGDFIIQSLGRKQADSSAWVAQKDAQRTQFRQAAEQARIQQYMEGVRAKAKIVDRRKDVFKAQADNSAALQ
jgi:peptidyl-prolyl cis-trans isomerase D